MTQSRVTKAMISRVMAEFSKKGSAKGGRARAKSLSDERRSEIARQGGKARWEKARASREAL